jgi:hypothetical protein
MRIVVISPERSERSIASPWLTTRKRPGKICRRRQFRHRKGTAPASQLSTNSHQYQCITRSAPGGTDLA